MSSKTTQVEKFIVRFGETGLRQRIAVFAKASNRSMNAEILHRLFHSCELEDQLRRANAVIDQLTARQSDEEGMRQ